MAQQWILRRRPNGKVRQSDLELRDFVPPALQDGEVRLRNILLSVDPSHRLWMDEREQYLEPVEIDKPMRGGVLGVVTETRSDRYEAGDVVVAGLARWESESVLPAGHVRRTRPVPGVSLTAQMSVLGATGLTAWFGMSDVGRPAAGETVVVSAAAGAVGSIAAQIAKLRGARVVGIAGSDEKCAWLTGELGLDAAINYRRENLGEALDRACPDGIDVSFENVGGAMLDAALARMNVHGRIALCGLISTYNDSGAVPGPARFDLVLMRRLQIRGFLVTDYLARAGEAMGELEQWIRDGRLKWKVHVVEGMESVPEALARLFAGDHDGKLLIRIAEDPVP